MEILNAEMIMNEPQYFKCVLGSSETVCLSVCACTCMSTYTCAHTLQYLLCYLSILCDVAVW